MPTGNETCGRSERRLIWQVLLASLLWAIPTQADTLYIKVNGSTPPAANFTIENQGGSAPSLRIHRPPVSPY